MSEKALAASMERTVADINRLLDETKNKLDCATDTDLAESLGVGASRICNYRKGRTLPNAWMARRIGRVLDVPPAEIVAAIRRAKRPE